MRSASSLISATSVGDRALRSSANPFSAKCAASSGPAASKKVRSGLVRVETAVIGNLPGASFGVPSLTVPSGRGNVVDDPVNIRS